MHDPNVVARRRHNELRECFKVVDTCLASYYSGAKHMYRPLAGQLRILLCDATPLLSRVFPDLKFCPLRSVEWVDPPDAPLFDGLPARLVVEHPLHEEFRLARMPFLITEYANGLQVADLQLSPEGQMLLLGDWMDQLVTVHPSDLSVREIVRSVTDKGGGAHVDDDPKDALRAMYRTGPHGVGVHVLFVVAIGRFAQEVGLHYTQFVEQSGFAGRLENVTFDPEHPAVKNCARVAKELEEGQRSQYGLMLAKQVR